MALKVYVCCVLLTLVFSVSAQQVQLAKSYNQQEISQYLVSEKFDGVRAIWRNGKLQTRSGKLINAPSWFTQNWPAAWLDGELWSNRGEFEFIASTVLDSEPKERDWHKIRFMVFDMPSTSLVFSERYKKYRDAIQLSDSKYLVAIKQHAFNELEHFDHFYSKLLNNGAEGVMLHRKDAHFNTGRTGNLLKLKPFQDAEAQVIGYSQGKGKYSGRLGALVVKLGNGVEFKIGSGLSDKVRSDPPPIGAWVTFRYSGFTKYGKPRFARFLRVRKAQ